MSANIYLNQESINEFEDLHGKDYYDRKEVVSKEFKPGYWINTELKVKELPDNAVIRKVGHIVNFPEDLRGCIYSNAPNLPEQYKESIEYWGKEPKYDIAGRFYQPDDHAYMLNPELIEKYEEGNESFIGDDDKKFDAMISEGIVLHIDLDMREVSELDDNDFVEIRIPIDTNVLSDGSIYDTWNPNAEEVIYLKVKDIKSAPGFYMDVIRYELLDYGYYY